MPWTEQQLKLFQGICKGSVPSRKGLSRKDACGFAKEGVKKTHRSKKK